MIGQCPNCKSSNFSNYGNSRKIRSDCLLQVYAECRECDKRYSITRSRHPKDVEGWPRPQPLDVIVISSDRPSQGFWIGDANKIKPSSRAHDIAIAPDKLKAERAMADPGFHKRATAGLACVPPLESIRFHKGWGYTEALRAVGYWPQAQTDPLRNGPSFLACALSYALTLDRPIVVYKQQMLGDPEEWNDILHFVARHNPHIQFVGSPTLEEAYQKQKEECHDQLLR